MPQWIHSRAEHILAKNPDMPKSEAFAIATQQSHALGKSPKGYGTAEGRHEAKVKYTTPGDDKKTANPGGLDSPKLASVIDELDKLGAITDEQAQKSLERYETLEKRKPTLGQVGRYAALGAVAGPALHMGSNAIKGKALIDVAKNSAGKAVRFGRTRALGAEAARGAVASGAIPMIRDQLDRRAEANTLQQYLHENNIELPKTAAEHQALARAAERAVKEKDSAAFGATPARPWAANESVDFSKVGFTMSQYHSGLGSPRFPQVSGQPGFRAPNLRVLVDQRPANIAEKIGAALSLIHI